MKYIISTLAGLILLAAQPLQAQTTQDPTAWTYEVKKTAANEYELIFHVSLKEGWHVFTLNPGDEFLIPPSFQFTSNNMRLVGDIQERGKVIKEKIEGFDNPVSYYEGKAEFVQKIQAKAPVTITGEHEYQVCNNAMCLPPKKKQFTFEIK